MTGWQWIPLKKEARLLREAGLLKRKRPPYGRQPLTLADSEPEPDIAVVSGARDDYRNAHPPTAKLVIEVAISSVDIDREKGTFYAAADIDEYVIVLPDQRSLEVHSHPTESGYKQRHDYQSDSTFELASFPNQSLDLSQLFR